MKERPILFSAPMVRAILEDRKTQTRRVVMVHPSNPIRGWVDPASYPWVHVGKHSYDNDKPPAFGAMFRSELGGELFVPCPYGVPGDWLWVQEAWSSGYSNGCWGTLFHADRAFVQGKRAHEKGPHYNADDKPLICWRHPIHMPRWASRITLKIESVRVERVQEIGEDDAGAEGVSFTKYANANARFHFREIWDTINAARGFGWDANPWVWVVEFRRVTA